MLRPSSVSLVLLAACVTEPAPNEELGPFPVTDVATWSATQDGREVGRVRLQEIAHPREKLRFYRVENRHRQRVGSIDASGRTWRLAPFQDHEQFVGIYPMAEGVRLLLELEGTVTLQPARGAREASGGRQ
jgi:hypothetical protein